MNDILFAFFLSWLITFPLTLTPGSMALASEYDWQPVERSTNSGGISITGRVVPQDGALNMLSARVQGRILSILAREGDIVHAETPLYEISSAECLSLVEEKRVAKARAIQELIEGVNRREKQLGLKLDGERCLITADRAGSLTKRQLESGSAFNSGDPVATILDTKRLTVELEVPEREHSLVKPGQKVTFQFASNPGQIYNSQIQNFVPTIDPVTRTSRALLSPFHTKESLTLDALVFGDIDTGHNEPILSVPSSALVFYHNQRYVVSGSDSKALAVQVQVLNETDSQSSVRPSKDGTLKVGDKVASRGAIFLLKKLSGEIGTLP